MEAPSGRDVVIIGAGIGGIASAARLAQRGWNVTVFEKNDIPGGRCGQLSLEGYRFDTGATLFLLPELYAETYRALGERMEDHLELVRIDPTYTLFFQDGSQLSLSSDLQEMRRQMETIEKGSLERMLAYLGEGSRHYALGLEKIITRDFRSTGQFLNPRTQPNAFRFRSSGQ